MSDRTPADLADALAVRLEHRATQNGIVRGYGIMPSSRPEDDDMDREAAALLRRQGEQLDTLRAHDDDPSRPLADHERSRCTAGHVRQMAEEYDQMEAERDEARRQLDTLRNAIGDPEELRLLSNWHAMECADMHGAGGGYDGCCSEAHRAIYLRGIYEAAHDALAAAGGGVPEEGATDEG